MTCELMIDVGVERFAAFAEVAFLERRPELGRLCRAAQEAGSVLGPAVVQAALPGVSDPGASNIFAWCRLLRICDDQGCLTPIGEDVAEGDLAPIPEQGVFEFWAATHPLLGDRILHLRRLDSRPDRRVEEIVPLPFLPTRNRVFTSIVRAEQKVILRNLASNHAQDGAGAGCIPRPTNSQCTIRWMLDSRDNSNRWQIEGRLDAGHDRAFETVHHEAESYDIDVPALFDGWATRHLANQGRWSLADARLAVPFAGVTEVGREEFSQDFTIAAAEVPGLGTFREVLLRDVPIGPATSKDATAWALSRMTARLRTEVRYRTRNEVRGLFLSVVEDTPLESQSPVLPDHGFLIQEYRESPELFWALAAPADLCPRPVDPEQNAELEVSSTQSKVKMTHGADVVHVPYRGGWSMTRLVASLLGGAAPRRVVLCDRYVRGDGNIAALGLLVSALKKAHSDVRLEVVTEADGQGPDNLKAIQAATGIVPRRYHQVFGGTRKDQPHVRYLLVQPMDGESFGWQMDNSPLDCRADPGSVPDPDSPLRWRDFVAVRVRPDGLPAELGRLLTGGGR